MTTSDRVDEILETDEQLTAEQRTALSDLFRAAYDQLTLDTPSEPDVS